MPILRQHIRQVGSDAISKNSALESAMIHHQAPSSRTNNNNNKQPHHNNTFESPGATENHKSTKMEPGKKKQQEIFSAEKPGLLRQLSLSSPQPTYLISQQSDKSCCQLQFQEEKNPPPNKRIKKNCCENFCKVNVTENVFNLQGGGEVWEGEHLLCSWLRGTVSATQPNPTRRAPGSLFSASSSCSARGCSV